MLGLGDRRSELERSYLERRMFEMETVRLQLLVMTRSRAALSSRSAMQAAYRTGFLEAFKVKING